MVEQRGFLLRTGYGNTKVIITAVARKLVAIANALVKARQKWSPQVT